MKEINVFKEMGEIGKDIGSELNKFMIQARDVWKDVPSIADMVNDAKKAGTQQKKPVDKIKRNKTVGDHWKDLKESDKDLWKEE